MPVITLEAGKLNKEQKAQLVKEFTETASKVTGIPPQAFYVFLKENKAEDVGIGGLLLSDSPTHA